MKKMHKKKLYFGTTKQKKMQKQSQNCSTVNISNKFADQVKKPPHSVNDGPVDVGLILSEENQR